VTDTADQDELPPIDDGDGEGPDVTMWVFGIVVGLALTFIAGTFFYDSIKDIFF